MVVICRLSPADHYPASIGPPAFGDSRAWVVESRRLPFSQKEIMQVLCRGRRVKANDIAPVVDLCRELTFRARVFDGREFSILEAKSISGVAWTGRPDEFAIGIHSPHHGEQ